MANTLRVRTRLKAGEMCVTGFPYHAAGKPYYEWLEDGSTKCGRAVEWDQSVPIPWGCISSPSAPCGKLLCGKISLWS